MIKEPLLLRAYRAQPTERTSIWMMRQAGRYLPEYREVRAKHSMLEVIRTPELAAKVTLQPIERYGFDAAIIFADILNPLIGMGITLDFVEGEGPKIFNPLRNRADIEKLIVPAPEDNVGYTLRAIEIAVKQLAPRGTPLIGFSGAPLTLTSYLCDQGEKDLRTTLEIMHNDHAAWDLLQGKLSTLVADYLIAQVHAGAAAVQIFDSWAGHLSLEDFTVNVLPYLQRIMQRVHSAVNVPIVYFARNAQKLYPAFSMIGADLFSVDWQMTLTQASEVIGPSYPLQGNLNPDLLLGAWEPLAEEATRILKQGATLKGFVFNLGHGILPSTPLENVQRLVDLVKKNLVKSNVAA